MTFAFDTVMVISRVATCMIYLLVLLEYVFLSYKSIVSNMMNFDSDQYIVIGKQGEPLLE